MTYNEIWEAFTKLSPIEKGRFLDAAKQHMKWNNTGLRAGAKVTFKSSKTGVVISGIFVRMKQKYAEVEANMDKYGVVSPYPLKWSVPPEMLRMVE